MSKLHKIENWEKIENWGKNLKIGTKTVSPGYCISAIWNIKKKAILKNKIENVNLGRETKLSKLHKIGKKLKIGTKLGEN